jgi:SEC-C motif-containing protein
MLARGGFVTDDRDLCPCGSSKLFASCCKPLLSGTRKADTAEALMRSRYCAYLHRNSDYLLATWHSSTKPDCLDLVGIPQPDWEALEMLGTSAGGPTDTEGRVEFIAHYRLDGMPGRLHENSRFRRVDGQWYYVDGDIRA